ncbi:MAG: UDP-forming cellulose synthase catalytic subunit [Ferrovum sp.]|nr:UDP-forming cellulose synthase catalytic subunit [Ferrovum sp.]NDU87583.1 UDP-forming cellulose synthase catalytic subunit [Ferrovum sp.]
MAIGGAPGVVDQAGFAGYFPHINFESFHVADIVRLPLQLLWLLLLAVISTLKKRSWRSSAPKMTVPGSDTLLGFLRRGWSAVLQQGLDLRGILSKSTDFIVKRVSLTVVRQEKFMGLMEHRPTQFLIYAFLVLVLMSFILTPFSTFGQVVFSIVILSLTILFRNVPGHLVSLAMIVMSLAISTRYIWWRLSSTLNWDHPLDLIWGVLLLIAEVYAYVFLVLGYFQTAWPLHRKMVPLPEDEQLWPAVDVYIPTYNEPLEVVRSTIYAAQGIDWPADKINIYLLDDGRRPEFEEFSAVVNIHYITRPDNRHAKAGNLNHAMTKTQGEFIAVFDCDHIPTRSFLQTTMGGFLKDPKLFLVQTPHQFYSADPYEKNLFTFRAAPNESELFYGLVQDGNDFWDSTFFCGSCAVLRRSALDEIGGVAVETVTEDAHTSLKLHRLGYRSAYLKIPQAAGLSTESLSSYIGQRIRWARGMAQIFRMDNPFLGRGLSLMQRISYGTAMLNFFSGIPRILFLTAPLAFLLFHAYVIWAPALTVLIYVLPHIFHAILAKSRLQGKYRSTFFSEVYETVLSWYIAWPTTVAMFNPKKGKFNVTAKGGLILDDYFDFNIAMPFIALIVLNIAGFAAGIYRMMYGPENEVLSVVFNLIWTFYNCLMLGCTLFVASEVRQVRVSHRVQINLPAMLKTANGFCLQTHTEDYSQGGISLAVSDDVAVTIGDKVHVSLWRGDEEHTFVAQVVSQVGGALRLQWIFDSIHDQRAYIQCTFGRADAWIHWSDHILTDKPLIGMAQVFKVGAVGYWRMFIKIPGIDLIQAMVTRMGATLVWMLPKTPKTMEYIWK